jgi:hypothetical protein
MHKIISPFQQRGRSASPYTYIPIINTTSFSQISCFHVTPSDLFHVTIFHRNVVTVLHRTASVWFHRDALLPINVLHRAASFSRPAVLPASFPRGFSILFASRTAASRLESARCPYFSSLHSSCTSPHTGRIG